MKVKIIVVFLLTAVSTLAQPGKEISIGIGPAFFGWGDLTAYSLSATFSYPIIKRLEIEPRLICSSGWQKEDISYNSGPELTSGYNFSQAGFVAFAASLVYSPFKGRAGFIKLKSGFLIGTMAHTDGSNLTGAYPLSYSEFGKEINKGLIHTLHFRILNKKKFFLGSELSMLTSFHERNYGCDGFVLNFMSGIRF